MPEGSRVQKTGTVGGTAVNVDSKHLSHAATVKVRLTAAYAVDRPPGWPTRPDNTGAAASNPDVPRTIPSGTTLNLLKPEADALVAAAGAVYV
jgi:hypothetical protein